MSNRVPTISILFPHIAVVTCCYIQSYPHHIPTQPLCGYVHVSHRHPACQKPGLTVWCKEFGVYYVVIIFMMGTRIRQAVGHGVRSSRYWFLAANMLPRCPMIPWKVWYSCAAACRCLSHANGRLPRTPTLEDYKVLRRTPSNTLSPKLRRFGLRTRAICSQGHWICVQ